MAGAAAPIFDDRARKDIMEQTEKVAKSVHSDGSVHNDDDDVHDARSVDDGEQAGGSKATTAKPFFNIIEVVGGSLPSENAKFSGNTPSVAARKAARRIWKRSNKTTFDIFMRKVCKLTCGRVLYKYHAEVEERDEPVAFFAAKAASFRNSDGTRSKDTIKRIHLSRECGLPVYGRVDEDGSIVECSRADAKQGRGILHRAKNTNTLVMGLACDESIPKKVGPYNIIRDDHIINVRRCVITDDEAEKFDIAKVAKQCKPTKEATGSARAARTPARRARSSSTTKRQPSQRPRTMAGGAKEVSGSSPPSSQRTIVRSADGNNAKSDAVLTFLK